MNNIKKSLVLATFLVIGYSLFANYALRYYVKDGVASITGVTGVSSPSTVKIKGNIEIPSITSNGYPVKSIEARAFQFQDLLTGVVIPCSITNIGAEAFWGCSSLVDVKICSTNIVIQEDAFFSTPFERRAETTKYKLASMSAMVGGIENLGRYSLSNTHRDRVITSLYIDKDVSIDSFVLIDGKVYDTVLRIVNNSVKDVHISMPTGYTYEKFRGADPFLIPASSVNILTITRTENKTFLITREELVTEKMK